MDQIILNPTKRNTIILIRLRLSSSISVIPITKKCNLRMSYIKPYTNLLSVTIPTSANVAASIPIKPFDFESKPSQHKRACHPKDINIPR